MHYTNTYLAVFFMLLFAFQGQATGVLPVEITQTENVAFVKYASARNCYVFDAEKSGQQFSFTLHLTEALEDGLSLEILNYEHQGQLRINNKPLAAGTDYLQRVVEGIDGNSKLIIWIKNISKGNNQFQFRPSFFNNPTPLAHNEWELSSGSIGTNQQLSINNHQQQNANIAIEVFSQSGKLLHQQKSTKAASTHPLGYPFPQKGVYYILIYSGNETIVETLMVE